MRRSLKLKIFMPLMGLLLSPFAFAKTKITDLRWESSNNKASVAIKYTGALRKTPDLELLDGSIQLTFSDAQVWPKIEKPFSFEKGQEVKLLAYQFSDDIVRFRIQMDYDKNSIQERISIILQEGEVVISFPFTGKMKTTRAQAPLEKREVHNVIPAQTDEKFLAKIDAEVNKELKEIDKGTLNKIDPLSTRKTTVDPLKNHKEKENGFSLGSYIGKFISLLGVMLIVLLAVMKFFKKGMVKTSKGLGILKSNDALSVLKTTYLAPKKSLMMVKAHNQVFLIGCSEGGIHFLSEIKDVVGVIKEGERDLEGTNFDSEIDGQEERKEGVVQQVLKEDITQSKVELSSTEKISQGLKDIAHQMKESIKISDQIKSKAKNLRPLQ